MEDGGKTILHVGGYFGSYHVLRLLGKGGTGEVYLVEDELAHASYAVKVLDPVVAGNDAEFVGRFVREAELAMKFRHRNLVSVYDAGCDPETGLSYLVMEYMANGTLRDALRALPQGIPWTEAVPLALDLVRALVFIEENGLVHRDIKPDNVLLTEDGTAKLTDFGVVSTARQDDLSGAPITHAKAVVGTPAYMAPEQMLDSRKVDIRSDIYSLGLVIYEMLAGRRPNEGLTAMNALAKALGGQTFPDVRHFRSDVPEGLATLVAEMVLPDAARRPASARAVLERLAHPLRASAPPAPTQPPPWYRDGSLLCAAVALVLSVCALLVTLIHAVRRGL